MACAEHSGDGSPILDVGGGEGAAGGEDPFDWLPLSDDVDGCQQVGRRPRVQVPSSPLAWIPTWSEDAFGDDACGLSSCPTTAVGFRQGRGSEGPCCLCGGWRDGDDWRERERREAARERHERRSVALVVVSGSVWRAAVESRSSSGDGEAAAPVGGGRDEEEQEGVCRFRGCGAEADSGAWMLGQGGRAG